MLSTDLISHPRPQFVGENTKTTCDKNQSDEKEIKSIYCLAHRKPSFLPLQVEGVIYSYTREWVTVFLSTDNKWTGSVDVYLLTFVITLCLGNVVKQKLIVTRRTFDHFRHTQETDTREGVADQTNQFERSGLQNGLVDEFIKVEASVLVCCLCIHVSKVHPPPAAIPSLVPLISSIDGGSKWGSCNKFNRCPIKSTIR